MQSSGRAETLFTGLPRPVCDFYDYNSVDYPVRAIDPNRQEGSYAWFTVKAVRFADESPGLCTPGLRASRPGAGVGLGVPGAANWASVLFNSTDGLHWRFMSTVMDAADYPLAEVSSATTIAVAPAHMSCELALPGPFGGLSDGLACAQEGSDEAALALLGAKTVIVITRMDGGDGTDTLPSRLRPPHMKPYRMAISDDGGFTFSRGQPMTDDQGRAIGCARPKLLPLIPDINHAPTKTTPLLLVGGRPGLFLWLSTDGAQSWKQYNIAAMHNAHSPLKYCPAFVSATPANASEYFSPSPSGAYSSIVQIDGSSALVCYNREPVLRE